MKCSTALLSVLFFLFTGNLFSQSSLTQRPKVGLVLSGGGAKGMAHIGVLKVLEEAGIPIDYIGGTSIGSIVGGLYAIGYSSRQLDSIAKTSDWDELLTDRIPRRKLSMNEKDEYIRYLVSFPIRGKKIALPTGVVAGQSISQMFSSLTAPVYNIKDFSKFPIPFLCIATDIEKGEPVVLKSGNLEEAMRASMSIPTVFTPEKIENRLLLDGGLINNFPVEEVKKMGADIVIGVDVGYRTLKGDELNSLVKIIEQSIFMHSKDRTQRSRDMCDILITPDLKDFNATSFGHADTLVARGELAARKQYRKIEELATYLKSFQDTLPMKLQEVKRVSEFYVTDIEINGLVNVPEDFLLRKIPIDVPGTIQQSEIDDFIEKMFGTLFFERITYDLVTSDDGVKLVFNVIEKNTNYFRVGLHYDPIFKSSLLLNTTFRNLLYRGSKISLDLSVGESPSFSALIYKNTGWNPKYSFLLKNKLIPDYGLHIQGHRYEVFQYTNDQRIASYNFTDLTTDFFLQSNISNNNIFGIGALGDFTVISNKVSAAYTYRESSYFLNLHAYYKNDSYDQANFPTRGTKVLAEVKYVTGLSEDVQNQKDFMTVSVKSNFIIPLSKRLFINEGICAAATFADSVPDQYLYYLGGLGNSNIRGFIPFVGMDFMQRANLNVLVDGLDISWEMWKDNFLTVKTNVGKAVANRNDFLSWNDLLYGGGISYGYRSPIGPMEMTLMCSNKNQGLSVFINIGYSF